MSDKPIFNVYSLPDLSEEEKQPPEFIVDGMIPAGLTFLSGAPKTRKSFLALQLAAAVANGSNFLGRTTKRCAVLYLDLEGSKSRAAHRAEKMSVPVPKTVYIANNVAHKLANGLVQDLQAMISQKPEIRLIIIDTYGRARGQFRAGGGNAYDCDISLLEPLQRFAITAQVAVLCVHHDRKGAAFAADSFERLSGTMGISGSADAVLNLIASGKRFDGKATLEFCPRDARGGEMQIAFDEHRNEWRYEGEYNEDPLQSPVCRFLIENAPLENREGNFISYEDLYQASFRRYTDNPSPAIRAALVNAADLLYNKYRIGVQLGAKSNGRRGVRTVKIL